MSHVHAELEHPLPSFPQLGRITIAEKLRMRETSAPFFRELRAALAATLDTLTRPDLAALAEALLPPTSLATGLHLEAVTFSNSCRSNPSSFCFV